jgi:hypothetical protein
VKPEAESAVLGFPQVEHLSKTRERSRKPSGDARESPRVHAGE